MDIAWVNVGVAADNSSLKRFADSVVQVEKAVSLI